MEILRRVQKYTLHYNSNLRYKPYIIGLVFESGIDFEIFYQYKPRYCGISFILTRLSVALSRAQVNPDDEDEARAWLETYNANAQVEYPISVEAEWNYNTNLTDENLDATVSIYSKI